MSHIVLTLYQKPQTIFTFKELSLLFRNLSYQSLKDKLSYAVETNKLLRLRKGVYAKINFNFFELANKLYTPSYISLETVLRNEGIIFQEDKTITVVSYLTRKLDINNQPIFYRKIANDILINRKGIIEKNNYFIASKERGFLDALFIYKNYHFDNLQPLDWEKINQLKKIYHNCSLEKRVNQYYQIYKKEYG